MASRLFGIRSPRGTPAIDRDDSAGDEAGLIGEQIGDGRRHLFGKPHTAERMELGHLLGVRRAASGSC
jgi:hypothetical protein